MIKHFAAQIRENFSCYLEVLRPGHWFKNLVVIFGAIAAMIYFKVTPLTVVLAGKVILSFFLACFISSVNYAINNITDEKGDSHHPVKRNRSIAGQKIPKASLYPIILLLLLGSLSTAWVVYGYGVLLALLALFIAGIFYNIKPFRFKDLPLLDVISESVNNPLRIFIGWFAIFDSLVFPPVSFLLLFWSLGAVLMSAKRYAELKFFLDSYREIPPFLYRNSYRVYTPFNVFLMVIFYRVVSIALFIIFSLMFRPRLLLSLPILLFFLFWFFPEDREINNKFKGGGG